MTASQRQYEEPWWIYPLAVATLAYIIVTSSAGMWFWDQWFFSSGLVDLLTQLVNNSYKLSGTLGDFISLLCLLLLFLSWAISVIAVMATGPVALWYYSKRTSQKRQLHLTP